MFSRVEERGQERDSLSSSPIVLGKLIRASYLTWPPERDPTHEDVYSSDIRDRATERRRQYLNQLAGLGTQQALDVFDQLAADPNLAEHRDSFLYQRDTMVRQSARRQNFSADETVVFLNDFTKAPTNVDEFRRLVKRHLVALLKRLRDFDDNEGYLFREGRAKEDDLKNWLSGRLRDVGNQWYTVHREQEVAAENKPDLRVYARQLELGNISIEIKLADAKHWTGDELVSKVETQLANQYMREFESHTGLYLLANAAKPKERELHPNGKVRRRAFRKIVNGQNVDFQQLVALVEQRAARLSTSPSVANKLVQVIAVDLTN